MQSLSAEHCTAVSTERHFWVKDKHWGLCLGEKSRSPKEEDPIKNIFKLRESRYRQKVYIELYLTQTKYAIYNLALSFNSRINKYKILILL